MIDLKNSKTCVFGIQGSGKTKLVEHSLVKNFKHPFVYLMHPEDFKTCKNNVMLFIPRDKNKNIDTSMATLNNTAKVIKDLAKQGKIDALIVDEADLFIPKNFMSLQKFPEFHDILINHRHYNLALIFISRRPQEISTVIVEQSEQIFLFAIDGKNVREHFARLHEDFEPLMNMLSKDKHNFIFKTLGERPQLKNPISIEK